MHVLGLGDPDRKVMLSLTLQEAHVVRNALRAQAMAQGQYLSDQTNDLEKPGPERWQYEGEVATEAWTLMVLTAALAELGRDIDDLLLPKEEQEAASNA